MTEAQAQAILVLLAAQLQVSQEIRDLLQLQTAVLDDVASEGCQHPEEARIDMSTPRDWGHWICSVCRYDNKADVVPMN